MHISEGILSLPVLAGGAGLAAAGLAVSLRRLPWRHIMQAGILAAAFFSASLIHVPLGPGNVHLIMNGLLGAVLGWAALPAIAVSLLLQAVLFQFGGLTSLGVNICVMGLPAVLCGLFFRRFFHDAATRPWAAFACGAAAVLLSGLLCALGLTLSGDAFSLAAWAIFSAHIPIMGIEGLLTMGIVCYLARVLPEMLPECGKPRRAPDGDPSPLRSPSAGALPGASRGR
jgi:cobalt/nickel transport system permease protein